MQWSFLSYMCMFVLYVYMYVCGHCLRIQVVKSAVPHIVPAVDSLEPDLSPISELLNMARAQHEITDDYLLEVYPCYSQNLLVVRSACGGGSSGSSGCSGSGGCRCGSSSDGFH